MSTYETDDLGEFLDYAAANNAEKDPPIVFGRKPWLPSSETFSIPPIKDFVERWLSSPDIKVVIDPFARNAPFGTITNDLNPKTSAQYHMDAREFLDMLIEKQVMADAVIFDPPYSPRQIAESYQGFGKKAGLKEVQIAALFRECRNKMTKLLRKGGVAISFGWSSSGFSDRRGFIPREILLIYHGAGRNDTICVAEIKGV